ncbi:MAG: hypothetical protein M3416_10930 [Acidobacteriota bacterium]|nr:hypothetical protein [Acidobacteriota bacterium]
MRERDARLLCEAMAKDFPSAEARAYVDAKLAAEADWWRRDGDQTEDAFRLAFGGGYPNGYLRKASVKHGAELLKQDLGYAEASAAERVLIEHAVLCHVRLGMVERLYSERTSGSYRIDFAEHYERRLTEAQKRFNRACEALAKVRKLAKPKVQINVAAAGGQQVNVA